MTDPAALTTAHELATICRLSYRQVDHWTVRGYLHAVGRSRGQGHRRVYAPEEVVTARIMAALVHAGVSVEAAGPAARTAVVDPEARRWFGVILGNLHVAGRFS